MLAQVLQGGHCQRQQEWSGMQWVRVLPADALRKAGSLQKAHQPSLESMLSAQAASGNRICPADKVHQHPAHPVHACMLLANRKPNLLTGRQARIDY